MIAELLRYPSGTATLAECLDSRGNGLPDFLGTGMVTALQGRPGASARMTLILRWCITGRIMSLLDVWFPLTTSPGPDC